MPSGWSGGGGTITVQRERVGGGGPFPWHWTCGRSMWPCAVPISARRSLLLGCSQPPASCPRSVETNSRWRHQKRRCCRAASQRLSLSAAAHRPQVLQPGWCSVWSLNPSKTIVCVNHNAYLELKSQDWNIAVCFLSFTLYMYINLFITFLSTRLKKCNFKQKGVSNIRASGWYWGICSPGNYFSKTSQDFSTKETAVLNVSSGCSSGISETQGLKAQNSQSSVLLFATFIASKYLCQKIKRGCNVLLGCFKTRTKIMRKEEPEFFRSSS